MIIHGMTLPQWGRFKVGSPAKTPIQRPLFGSLDPNRIDGRVEQFKEAGDPWPDNVKVFTSSSQLEYAWYDTSGGGAYTRRFLHYLPFKRIRSLNGVHRAIGAALGRGKQVQHPQASSNPIRVWRKDETRPRFILTIIGDNDPYVAKEPEGGKADDVKVAERDCEKFNAAMQKVYDIPDEHLVTLHQPTVKQLEKQIKQMAKSVDEQSEVLIDLACHGFIHGSIEEELGTSLGVVSRPDINDEGSLDGYVLLRKKPHQRLYKGQMKALCRQYLSKAKSVTILMDVCKSGAWVA